MSSAGILTVVFFLLPPVFISLPLSKLFQLSPTLPPLQITQTLLFPFLLLSPCFGSPLIFLISVATPVYVLNSEDLELGTSNETEQAMLEQIVLIFQTASNNQTKKKFLTPSLKLITLISRGQTKNPSRKRFRQICFECRHKSLHGM